MSFLDELESFLLGSHPELESARTGDGSTLRIAEAGRLDDAEAPEVHVHLADDSVLLDWVWRVPVTEGRHDEIRAFLLDYAREAFENHGWEVPILLLGGPLNGKSLTKRREDLVGRLLFARKPTEEKATHAADVYKWHLKRNPQGEYVCVFERSLLGPDLDKFIARGVESTGPFTVINGVWPADRSSRR